VAVPAFEPTVLQADGVVVPAFEPTVLQAE
jgi:hypothetical protein